MKKTKREQEQGMFYKYKKWQKTEPLGDRILLLSAGSDGCNFLSIYPDFWKDKKTE